MVLITGSSGFVGGHLLVHLHKNGKKIKALRRKTSNFNELKIICDFYNVDFNKVISDTEWIEGDLLNIESIKSAFDDVDVVYHCAAIVSFGETSPETLKRTNITGTRNLVTLAQQYNISYFAFVSSIGALGQSIGNALITEETPWREDNNSSLYSNTKYESEQIVWEAIHTGMNAVIVNPGIILGAGDFSRGSLRFFSQVEKGMPFYTSQQTGYVDVRDVCSVIQILVERKIYNQRFTLVSENLTNKELFSMIARGLGKTPPFILLGHNALNFAGWIDRLISKITGKKVLLTNEIIHSATKKECYSSQKIRKVLDFTFIPINKCIKDALFRKNR